MRQAGRWAGATLPESGPLTEALANPTSPFVNKRTTLKDALSLLLDGDVQVGIVTDRAGAVQGLVTVDMIAERMREGHIAPAYLVDAPRSAPADSAD
jgi:Mg2+/Co2+ transporter CorB